MRLAAPLLAPLLAPLGMALVAACGAPGRALAPHEADALAAAYGPRPAAWTLRGAYRDATGEGAFEDAYAADGRFARRHGAALPGGAGEARAGADPAARGAWTLPLDGLARPSGGPAAAEARAVAALVAGTWPRTLRATRRGDHAFTLATDGHDVGELRLDPTTGLPAELRLLRGERRRLRWTDWFRPAGFAAPRRMVLEDAGGLVATWSCREAAPAPDEADLFAPPPPPDDARFAAAAAPVAARALGPRVLVDVRGEGARLGWWLLDTGAAASAVDVRLADRLGWPRIAAATRVGAAGRSRGTLRRAGRITLGPLAVRDLPVLELDAAALSAALGVEVRGILGADVLARCVLELEPGPVARVVDPAAWSPPAGATRVHLDGAVPLLAARFAPGHEGALRLDTGSDDTITFHGPTVRRLGLAAGREDLRTVRVRGLAGEALGDRGVHPWVEVAGRRHERLPVTYLRRSTGGLEREDVVGNAGAALFAGRALTLALPHGCIVAR